MGFFAARAVTRSGARQQYRTMARMQRRRSYFQSSTGAHQDFTTRDDEAPQEESQPKDELSAQLENLADLKAQGVLTDDEFSAKKKQLLGI